MKSEDAEKFGRILRDLFDATGYEKPGKSVVMAWWKVFQDVDLQTFQIGCEEFFATRQIRPLPARIRELMPVGRNLWPAVEEAWNHVPKSEVEGGWLCQEIASAMNACADSLARGDLWAARRAFVEVYERELRSVRGKPQWWYSEASGGTAESRARMKLQAMEEQPDRVNPKQIEIERLRLEQMSGSSKTERQLQPVSGLLPSTSQERKQPRAFLRAIKRELQDGSGNDLIG